MFFFFFVFRSFVREIYDGQLLIKLKRGFDFPALDPWVCGFNESCKCLSWPSILIGFISFRERVIPMW